MARFLVKTEPSTYSYADLERDKRTVWDGVSNPVALKHLATIRKGDTVVVYHTGDEKQAVGLAVAASDAYPDPKLKNPKRPVVDLAVQRCPGLGGEPSALKIGDDGLGSDATASAHQTHCSDRT